MPDLRKVFNKSKVSYHNIVLGIVQLNCTTPPSGCVYLLSLPETKAMEEHIAEALAWRYICPAKLPAAMDVFFW